MKWIVLFCVFVMIGFVLIGFFWVCGKGVEGGFLNWGGLLVGFLDFKGFVVDDE